MMASHQPACCFYDYCWSRRVTVREIGKVLQVWLMLMRKITRVLMEKRKEPPAGLLLHSQFLLLYNQNTHKLWTPSGPLLSWDLRGVWTCAVNCSDSTHQSGPQPGSPWDCPKLCLVIIQTLHAITLQEGKEQKEKEKEEEENTEASENWKR